ncbi:MAG: metallophosphoesterase family protein [Lentisphaerae bacterium]|nr:metallophosphoesterase family protein [Lentisphaerota bacterium]
MKAIFISDVHLGSPYCRADDFLRFLDALPEGETLVLNGDGRDYGIKTLPPRHREALDRLVAESRRRRVVWVRGNHDERYQPPDPGGIEFRDAFTIGGWLYAAHGHAFDTLRPYNRPFIIAFKLLHTIRVRLGAPPVHVAFYAKKFAVLYRILRRTVNMNAMEYAKENGYTTVVCGHTHHIEDETIDGIRVLNTGSWTEAPVWCVRVNDADVTLEQVR